MNLPNIFKKPGFGLDLGSRTIKGVKLKKKNGQVFLDRFFFHDLAQTSDQYPEQSNLTETLKAKVEMSRLSNSSTAVNIQDDEVFNFNFTLPKMKESEMRFAVAHEIQDSINISIDDLSFDYIVIDDANTPMGENVKVKAYCAKRDAVVARTEALKAAKLKPESVESDILALIAMLGFNDYLAPEKNYAVFDLGESHITTVLIANGELIFSKTTKSGCGLINQTLNEQLSLNYMDAEQLKVQHDFNQTTAAQDTASGRIIDHAFVEIFRDVKETIELFREQLSRTGRTDKIDKVLLVGGGSRIQNVERVFELFFKIPTTTVNPFKNIQIYESGKSAEAEEIGSIASYMGTAVGLALREIA